MNSDDTFTQILLFGFLAILIPIVIALLYHFTPLTF